MNTEAPGGSQREGLAGRVGAVVSVVVVGVLAAAVAGPRWWWLLTSPAEGVRVQVSPWGADATGVDLALYLIDARQAFDGTLLFGVFFGPERDQISIQAGLLWLQVVGVLGWILGDLFVSLAMVTTVGALAAIALLWALSHEITGSRLGAAAATALAVAGAQAYRTSEGVLTLRNRGVLHDILSADPLLDLHAWSRFAIPIVALAPVFGFIWTVPRAVETGRRAWMVAAVVALALTIYSYTYFWTAGAAALAGWTVWLALEREWVQVRRLLAIGALAGLLALPELAGEMYNAITLSDDAAARLGVGEDSVVFRLSTREVVVHLAIGVVLFFVALRERHVQLYGLLYAVPLVLAYVPLGVPQPYHYIDQIWPVFAIPLALAAATGLARRLPAMAPQVAGGILAVVALSATTYTVVLQVRATADLDAVFTMRRDEKAAFAWMDRELSGNDVVVSPSVSTNLYLSTLTPARPYLPEAFVPANSDEEVIDRYLRVSAAYGYSAETALGRLDPDAIPEAARTAADKREEAFEASIAFYLLNWEVTDPDSVLERMPAWRARYLELQGESDVLGAHRATYLYCGRRERIWPAEEAVTDTWVAEAFEEGEVTVYRLVGPDAPGASPFTGCGSSEEMS